MAIFDDPLPRPSEIRGSPLTAVTPPPAAHTPNAHTPPPAQRATAARARRPWPAPPGGRRRLPAPGQRRPWPPAPPRLGPAPPTPEATHARGRPLPRPPRSPPLTGAAEPQATSSQAFGARGRCRPRPETAAAVHSLRDRCPEAAAARRRVTRGRSRPRARRTLSARPPEAVVESSHVSARTRAFARGRTRPHVSARTRPFARGRTRPHVSARTQLHTGRQPSLLWAIQVISNFINVML
jgi:hypothetical protein